MCRAFEEYGKEQRAAGITEGHSKGLAEGKNDMAREVASKLISLGKNSIEEISAATGLTPAQIKQLEK